MNLYQPCVKLKQKVRIGSRITRRYDQPQTPLDRLITYYAGKRLPKAVRALRDQRDHTDPFMLSKGIDKALGALTRIGREKWNKAEMSLAYAVQNGASGSEVLQSLALAQIKLDHTLQAKISIKKLLEKNPSDTVALELQSMLPQE